MGRSSRAKEERRISEGPKNQKLQITHEPPPGRNKDDDFRVNLADSDDDECIELTIHGVTHLIHTWRALNIMRELHRISVRWENENWDSSLSLPDNWKRSSQESLRATREYRKSHVKEMSDEDSRVSGKSVGHFISPI